MSIPKNKQAYQAFQNYGSFCARHPSEVLFLVVTTTIFFLSDIDWHRHQKSATAHSEYHSLDILFMTVLRGASILYILRQFQNIGKLESRFLTGISGFYVVFSCMIYCCTVLAVLNCQVTDLKDALFFYLLTIDLSKLKYLVESALNAQSYEKVQTSISDSLSNLGPSFTLDTISESLLVAAGTLTDVSRVEQICAYGVVSVLVNYILTVTLFPACLSFVLELSSRAHTEDSQAWIFLKSAKKVKTIKSNPVKQGVKIIMSAGLFLIHGITRYSVDVKDNILGIQNATSIQNEVRSESESFMKPPYILQMLNASVDNIVLMMIVIVFMIHFTFLDSFWPKQNLLLHQADSKSVTDDSTQTSECEQGPKVEEEEKREQRTLQECLAISKSSQGMSSLSNEEILMLMRSNHISQRSLETGLKNSRRAVEIRRKFVSEEIGEQKNIENIPFSNYNYDKVHGACCENVIGFVPIPLGYVGPLRLNGRQYTVPLATTEGALLASTSRGCKAISKSAAGANAYVYKDGMSRGPVVTMRNAGDAVRVHDWIKDKTTFEILQKSFNSTSNYARLSDVHVFIVGRLLYLRFEASTGDAMGMNMVAKGTEAALATLKSVFKDMKVISISGNVCTDKKPSAINWILGRGKSVTCDATFPSSVVEEVLKIDAATLVETNHKKNFIGSAVAGSIGGNNAHAANIIAALFIACGQDPAQVVDSSSCMTVMEVEENGDLYMSVTMPCLEVGTVGGGTILEAQSACLNMLGIKGANVENPGENARRLAEVAAATVMAGELSLMASLAKQTLVQSHMHLNRHSKSSPKLVSSN